MSLSRAIIKAIITALLLAVQPAFAAHQFTVVIDAGHGAADYGAIGKTSNEKSINLAVALKLGELIKQNMKGVKVVYTRDDDTFVPLQGRADIANKAKGDLFISIHANSIDKKARNYSTISGASVYTLGFRRSKENLEVAMRENEVMKLESDYSTTYEGFDPSSTESYIIFEMSQNKHLEQSIQAANEIQKELITTAGRKDRGVRQANFWVLFKTGMPAILVELDFICNPREEKFMSSAKGRDKLATAIYNGFARYKASADHRAGIMSEAPVILQAPVTEKTSETEVEEPEEDATVQTTPERRQTATRSTPILYKVQFLASPKRLPDSSPKFKGLKHIESYTDGGMIKYTVGSFETIQQAQKKLAEVRKKFSDAFIIKTQDGKRIK